MPEDFMESVFGANKENRELTNPELHQFAQVDEAKVKETKNFTETKAARSQELKVLIEIAGRGHIPWSWAIQWKHQMDGMWVLKAHLCLKGFVEDDREMERSARPPAGDSTRRLRWLRSSRAGRWR